MPFHFDKSGRCKDDRVFADNDLIVMYLVAWRIAVASRLSCDRNENVRTANRKRKFKTMDHDPKSIKVMKFGGTSVGSPAMIKHVARLISNEEPKLVVLSAMSGTTNALAAIAAELSRGNISGASDDIGTLESKYLETAGQLYFSEGSAEKARRHIRDSFSLLKGVAERPFSSVEEKIVLAQGELIVTMLMHLYLAETGVRSTLLPALEFMRTDKNGEPDMRFIRRNARKAVNRYPHNRIFITQGYICRNAAGEVDNLQRGGSDYTASLLGAALDASEIQIWTDIDGLHNNDPRVVSSTVPVRRLTFDEASKLAHFGAKILHPTCILPAKLRNIPVRLLDTMDPSAPGTLISDSADAGRVKAVAAKDGVVHVKIRSMHKIPGYRLLDKVFHSFARTRTSVDLVAVSDNEISLATDNRECLSEILDGLSPYADIAVEENMTIVCVVGDLKRNDKSFRHKIIDSLRKIPLRMISYGDNCDVSFVLRCADKKKALEALNSSCVLQ